MPQTPSGVSDSDGPDTKRHLRDRAKANRTGLVVDDHRVRRGLERFLEASKAQRRNRSAPDPHVVVLYSALPGEPDVGPLAERADLGPFALTRTPDDRADRSLTIHFLDGRLERHRFGYEQPTSDAPLVEDDDIAVVLVPGLAFDRHGGRLGFGAGYYDRLLGRLGPHVMRIGVCDGTIIDRIPTEPHDVAMTHLATEIGVVPLPL